MATGFDASEFVDREFDAAQSSFRGAAATSARPDEPNRAPTRDEVDTKVGDVQSKLAELKRAQAALEQERASLEETRRRQTEFTTGRQEVLHDLTRGIKLLEETEFAARRDAEQMARSLGELREVLNKVQSINDMAWTKDDFQLELTRANTTIESARMEWNSARLKWTVLSPENLAAVAAKETVKEEVPLADRGFMELCLFGLALTWPVLVGIAALIVVLLLR